MTNLTDTVKRLKEKNIWVYGADLDGANYTDTDLTGAVALVIGSGGRHRPWAEKASGRILTPAGTWPRGLAQCVQCLRGALYEVLRQNRAKK